MLTKESGCVVRMDWLTTDGIMVLCF